MESPKFAENRVEKVRRFICGHPGTPVDEPQAPCPAHEGGMAARAWENQTKNDRHNWSLQMRGETHQQLPKERNSKLQLTIRTSSCRSHPTRVHPSLSPTTVTTSHPQYVGIFMLPLLALQSFLTCWRLLQSRPALCITQLALLVMGEGDPGHANEV